MVYRRWMHDNFDRLDRSIRAAIAGLSAAQTQATPVGRPDKWSIQQIIEHLLRTYRASAPAIQTRIEKGHPTLAITSVRQRAGQFVLIKLGLFPHGRQAPVAVCPAVQVAAQSGEELAEGIHRELIFLDDLIHRAESVFGNVRAATHGILGPLSMRQWRRFHLIHGRHHIKQIRAIRLERSF